LIADERLGQPPGHISIRDISSSRVPHFSRSLREVGFSLEPVISPSNVHRSQTRPRNCVYSFLMPWGLKRYYGTGSLHFITWSCYRRKPLLGNPARRDLVLIALELMRVRYRFAVIGYVVMPEHVHLLISEPLIGDPSKIIQVVKLSVSRRLAIAGEFSGRFWQSRFYDFNLWGQQKEVEKLKYMHRNPVVRGLVACPEDWPWSSYQSYACGEPGLVRINDWIWWEEKIRPSAG
jgi:putative transposase